jgi:hypothetical protein
MRFGQSGDKTIIRTPRLGKGTLGRRGRWKDDMGDDRAEKANLSGREREYEGDRKRHLNPAPASMMLAFS